jgi:membrane protein implicated in regulation of membrane protease activity
LLAIFAFLILSYQVCGLWNEEPVCDRRVNHLMYAVVLGILALMGYTRYLRRRLEKQQRVSASGEGKTVKGEP